MLGTWAGVVHEFFKNPLEVGIRICASAADLLDPALRDVDDGAAPAGVFASDEHPVFVAEFGGANRVWVLVAQSAPSIKVNMSLFKACGKLGPFRLGVVQRFAQGTPRGDAAAKDEPRNLQESHMERTRSPIGRRAHLGSRIYMITPGGFKKCNRCQKNLGKAVRRATLATNDCCCEISRIRRLPAWTWIFSYRNTAHIRAETLLPSPFPPPSVRPPFLSTAFTPKANS